MKKSYLFTTALLILLSASAVSAETVQKTSTVVREKTTITKEEKIPDSALLREIRDDKDLSDFYHVLIASNIDLNDFNRDSYTVFAPTNQAFRDLDDNLRDDIKTATPAELSALVEAHIVPGAKYLNDLPGGYGVLSSVDRRPLEVRKLGINDYYVNGQRVVSENDAVGSSILYKTRGFMISPDVAIASADTKSMKKKVSIIVPENSEVITIEQQ